MFVIFLSGKNVFYESLLNFPFIRVSEKEFNTSVEEKLQKKSIKES